MTLGFTGSQSIPHMGLYHLFDSLEDLHTKYSPEAVVLGACVGYDEEIQVWHQLNRPSVRRIVVVPANRTKVGSRCLADPDATFVMMPPGTSYRDRNTRLVELCDRLSGFWTGRRIGSGTFMTLNIGRKAQKLDISDIHGVPPVTDEEAQYLYTHGDVQ